MKAVFIADAHLLTETSPGYRELLDFFAALRGEQRAGAGVGAIYADQLFILGDFFDFWFARGERFYPPFREVVSSLARLSEAGVLVHFCEGNHDFFLADYFGRHPGMQVLSDFALVTLGGRRILISHGDTAGRIEPSYRFLRAVLRSGLFYRLQRLLPLSLLFAAARLASRTSRELGRDKTEELAEQLHAFARQKLAQGLDAVVLGHCHKPLLIEYDFGGRPAVSVTVGGWNRHRSYLYFADGAFSLRYF